MGILRLSRWGRWIYPALTQLTLLLTLTNQGEERESGLITLKILLAMTEEVIEVATVEMEEVTTAIVDGMMITEGEIPGETTTIIEEEEEATTTDIVDTETGVSSTIIVANEAVAVIEMRKI
jgi:hypothetical protein